MTLPFARISLLLFAPLVFLDASGCHRDASHEQKTGQAVTTTSAGDMPSLQPQELSRILSHPGDKPLLFHVGFRKLYQQAHIPGSEFLGPTSDDEVLAGLRQRVAALPRTTNIVIYCGCCPWERCPNVKPAYRLLHELGFTNAKVLFIPEDLGTDWVDRGFAVAKGD